MLRSNQTDHPSAADASDTDVTPGDVPAALSPREKRSAAPDPADPNPPAPPPTRPARESDAGFGSFG